MPTTPFTQEDRAMQLTTPLGKDEFILTSFSGSEQISGLFQYELNVVWQGKKEVVFKDILAKSVTVTVESHKVKRYFNGIVKSITQGARIREHNVTRYTLTVVPTMWLLTRKVNCLIFQDMTTADIIQKVLKDGGITEINNTLTKTYDKRDYCVQYYETDFAFISRLMEYEGIYYFFKHEDGKHTLYLADDKTAFSDVTTSPTGGNLLFEETVGGARDEGRIWDWQRAQEINTGKFTVNDYNFETPSSDLASTAETTVTLSGNSSLEFYENPGDFFSLDKKRPASSGGEDVAKIRVAEEEMRTQVVNAKGFHCGVTPGFKFTLKGHYTDDGKYTITGATHSGKQPLDTGRGSGGEGFVFENQFSCIANAVQYRPLRVTPLPSVRGVQTALVVGTAGEEIYTDKYGRVKVQFYWDRKGQKDEKSSCWVRVATYWAGKNWGAIHIPRIGQEVIVDFVEGDVDRPIIIGSVYNATQMPPYALPANKTQSTLKSNSSKGGEGFNEIRLEDKKGSEEVFFHAEKDLNSVVENNETRKVGSTNSKKCTDGNRTTEIFNNEVVKVGDPKAADGSRTTTIYKDETLTVKTGDMSTTVEQGNQSITVKTGNQSTVIKTGNQTEEVSMGNQTITVKMGNQSTDIKMGNQSTKLALGAATHEAMQSITLKVGQNSIVVDQMGIHLKGLMIDIKAQVMVQVQAPITQIKGDGMVQIQGGIVMIN